MFEIIPNKISVNSRLREKFTYGIVDASVGKYGSSSFSYDFDFSDNEGGVKIDISEVTRQSITIRTNLKQNAGWLISSSTNGHILESSAVIKCLNKNVKTQCDINSANQYRSPAGVDYNANFEGNGMSQMGQTKGIKVHLVANVIG